MWGYSSGVLVPQANSLILTDSVLLFSHQYVGKKKKLNQQEAAQEMFQSNCFIEK